MTIYVVLMFLSILVGMAISVKAFGTGGKRAKVFEDIYFSVEDVEGIGIVYTKSGDYSALMEIENPVQKYSADTDSYYDYQQLFTKICQSLGESYILQKQDVKKSIMMIIGACVFLIAAAQALPLFFGIEDGVITGF